MGYEPQHFIAPDGTKTDVLTAAEVERLRDLADDAEDVVAARVQLERIRQGEQGVHERTGCKAVANVATTEEATGSLSRR